MPRRKQETALVEVMPADLTVPQWTADDFTRSTKPYDFVYQFHNDSFKMRQVLEMVKTQAAAVKIRGFMNLWKLYVKSLSGEVVESSQNITDFDGLPLKQQLVCGKYICDSSGVSVVDGFGVAHSICTHPIAPVRRFKNVDTGEELLELWYRRGTAEGKIKDETHIVPKDVIANGITGLARYGIAVSRKNDKDLSAYIMEMEQYNYDALDEEKSVKRLGWVGDGYEAFSPYVDHIFFDGEDDFGSIFAAVTQKGTLDAWRDIVTDVRKQKTAARYYLAASFASAILKPCGLLPFMIHVFGGSENGKTVLLMLAASVWADPALGEYVTTFNGTRYAQETRAGFLNNLPMCLDELQIQTSQGVKDFDDIIYQLCEGVSKTQGKASGGLRKQTRWRNVILSNGEHTIIKPLSGGGARNRVIEIESPEKIYTDLVGLCDKITHNYGWAGKEFVSWLMQPDNLERVRIMQKDYYRQLTEHGVTEKQAGSASAILTADAIATELIFKDGLALTVDEITEILLRKGDIDINAKTLDWLFDFIASNQMHFDVDSRTEFWGRIDEEEGVVYIIRSILDREFSAQNLDSKSFLAWALRNEKIIPYKDGVTKVMKIPGTKTTARVVQLKLQEHTENVELPTVSDVSDLPF